jgi:hypothetical protein
MEWVEERAVEETCFQLNEFNTRAKCGSNGMRRVEVLKENIKPADENFRHKVKEADAEESTVNGAPALPDIPINSKKRKHFVVLVLEKIVNFVHIRWDGAEAVPE